MVNLKKKNRKSTKEYLIATGGKALVLVSVLANFTEIATWTENFMERHAGKNSTSASIVELKQVQAVDTVMQEQEENVVVAGSAYMTNDAIREVTFVEPELPAEYAIPPEEQAVPEYSFVAPPAEHAIPEHVCRQEVAVVEDVDVIECFH
ncbi:MAG: hypothetical protein K2H82_07320 [Oscillospiraceae bacterium]|nr:hypothetical protein [Oscillospiraceae bacterium]